MYGNLRKELYMRSITMKDLAEHLGISTRTLQNKMNGKTDWTLTEALEVLNIIPGLTLEYLFAR